MPDVSKKRRLSRKGCVSCKRLKIKCNEGKPACDYCIHRGRECVYPGEVNDRRNLSTTKKPAGGSGASLRIHSFNSAQVQLNITRFEHRLLRFFNDHCVQVYTFNHSPRAENIWRNILPTFFGTSQVLRQAVFALACLNLWPIANLEAILAEDDYQSGSSFPKHLEYTTDDLSHVFNRLSIGGSKSDSSILDHTNVFFDNVMKMSAEHIVEATSRGIEYADVAIIYLSTTLTYTYIGLHPHCVMPLVDFEHDPPSDLLAYSRSIHNMMRNAPPNVYEALLHNLTEFTFTNNTGFKYHLTTALIDELERQYSLNQYSPLELGADDFLGDIDYTVSESECSVPVSEFEDSNPTTPSSGVSPMSSKALNVSLLHEDSTQLFSQPPPEPVVYELDSQTSMEIETLRNAITIFETCFHTSITANFPMPLYKLLPFLGEDFSALARAKNPMALRILLLYSLLCLYGHFYFQRHKNLWWEYITWYVEKQGLSGFDRILYNFVVLQNKQVDEFNTAECFSQVDMLYQDYLSPAASPFDIFGDATGSGVDAETDAVSQMMFNEESFFP